MRHFQDFLVRRAAWLSLFVSLISALSVCPAAAAGGVWPLTPRPAVVRGFELPPKPWLPGHRGVDLLGNLGQSVRAASAGTVVYAGALAGRGIVVIAHGAIRTTYEPVVSSVHVGDQVSPGDPIGTLSAAPSHCAPRICLHWGLLRGPTYLNPLSLLSSTPVRLLPTTKHAARPPATDHRSPPPGDPAAQPPALDAAASALASDHAAQPFTSDHAAPAPATDPTAPTPPTESAAGSAFGAVGGNPLRPVGGAVDAEPVSPASGARTDDEYLRAEREPAPSAAASPGGGGPAVAEDKRVDGERAGSAPESDGAGRVFVGVAALLTLAGGLLIRRH